jgi:hypothetical protein
MLKKIARTAIRGFRKWLEEAPARRPHDYHKGWNQYPWLNSLLLKLVEAKGGAHRPAYAWGVLHGANLAKALGIKRVSVVEFGVAGGNGLIALEKIAAKVEEIFGVGIDVYGFDTGYGLPKPQDYRDLPNLYSEGFFPMDVDKLKSRLTRAQLILGPVEHTVPQFMRSKPSAIAFISVDLDLYSSTIEALTLFDADQALLLPRVHCYFDDIIGFTFSDYNGERLAMAEFNASRTMRKISPIYGLRYFLPQQYRESMWSEKFYMAHIFDHDLYGRYDGLSKLATLDLKDEEGA